MNKENYFISIIGKQHYEENESGEVKVDTVGSYEVVDGTKYITYREYEEGNPSISSISTLTIDKQNTVTLSKENSLSSLVLEKGKRHNSFYQTDFGQINLGVFTSELINNLDDMGGKLEINYTLDINSNISSKNELTVTVKSIDN